MSATAERTEIVWLRPSQLKPWPGLNPRTHFSEERIRELAVSIAEKGVLQNLVVQDTGTDVHHIVSGESRWRASKLAEEGIPEIGLEPAEVLIPCRMVHFTEAEALAIALLENIQRASLTPIEEAKGFRRLLDLNPTWTQARVAEEILGDAKRQAYVAQRLALLDLPDQLQEWVQEDVLKASHARDHILPLLRLPDQQGEEAVSRLIDAIRQEIDAGRTIQAPWLSEQAAGIRADVQVKYGPKDLFSEPTGEEEPFEAGMRCIHGVPSDQECEMCTPPVTSEQEQSAAAALDEIVRRTAAPGTPGQKAWEKLSQEGATDNRLLHEIRSRFQLQTKEVIRISGLGAYQLDPGVDPCITIYTPADGSTRQFRGGALVARCRRIFGVGHPANELPMGDQPDESPAATYADWEIARGYDVSGDPVPSAVEEVRRSLQAEHPLVERKLEAAASAAAKASATRDPFAAPVAASAAPAAPSSEPTAPEAEPKAETAAAHEVPSDTSAPQPSSEADPEPNPAAPAPAPARKPAVKPAPPEPAPAPAPTPPAEPVSVLPPPDAKREAIPEGAGLIAAILTATGGRPGTLAYHPLPDGRVAVTIAPKILKTGERPFALTAAPEEIDALLVPAIDAHFTI